MCVRVKSESRTIRGGSIIPVFFLYVEFSACVCVKATHSREAGMKARKSACERVYVCVCACV